MDPDPDSGSAIRKNAGSGSVSGSALNQCGSATLDTTVPILYGTTMAHKKTPVSIILLQPGGGGGGYLVGTGLVQSLLLAEECDVGHRAVVVSSKKINLKSRISTTYLMTSHLASGRYDRSARIC